MSTTASQLLGIRSQLLDRIWLGLLLLALIGTPASLSRALATGWIPLYTVHASLAALVVVMYVLRRRIRASVQSATLLAIFFVLGTVGMLTLGLMGAGFWWLAGSTLLAGTLYSHRVGVAVAAATAVLIAVSGVLFTRGVLEMQVDPTVYAYAPTSWISFLIVASIMPLVLFHSITLFQRSTLDLLDQIERQRIEIERLASHDALTALPRWDLAESHFRKVAAVARRAGHKVALLFIDLDGFKVINDAHGHEAGDRVLQAVAARLCELLRAEDMAARIGGDEFVVVLGNVADPGEAQRVAERLLAAVAVPIPIDGVEVAVGASVGVALLPDHGDDAGSLRQRADKAMYAAKAAGRNQAAVAA